MRAAGFRVSFFFIMASSGEAASPAHAAAAPRAPASESRGAGGPWASILAFATLMLISISAFSIRLFSVIKYESVIHEFDPYFNYRVTQYLSKAGIYEFWNWFDDRTWYLLGRVVGGSVYPGLTLTAGTMWWLPRPSCGRATPRPSQIYHSVLLLVPAVENLLLQLFKSSTAMTSMRRNLLFEMHWKHRRELYPKQDFQQTSLQSNEPMKLKLCNELIKVELAGAELVVT